MYSALVLPGRAHRGMDGWMDGGPEGERFGNEEMSLRRREEPCSLMRMTRWYSNHSMPATIWWSADSGTVVILQRVELGVGVDAAEVVGAREGPDAKRPGQMNPMTASCACCSPNNYYEITCSKHSCQTIFY